MNEFNTNLDKAFAKALEAEDVTIKNNKIDLDKVYKYIELAQARDILHDVVENSEDDNIYLVEQFNDLTINNIYNVLFNIVSDDYIIGDWNSVTDYHEYMIDTQTIITEETGIKFL